tara:strand:- start:143 stop:403 length:261 start_codon:yes stop_codon:yes gene_type:complete
MINPKEILNDLQPGDRVQVISEHFNGGVGVLNKICESYIYIKPFIDDENTEPEYGSITHDVLFPISEIKLIIKINMEATKTNEKNR